MMELGGFKKFLMEVVPDEVPMDKNDSRSQSRDDLISDIFRGISASTMTVRITLVYLLFLLSSCTVAAWLTAVLLPTA